MSLNSGDSQQKSRRRWKIFFEVSYFVLLLLLQKRQIRISKWHFHKAGNPRLLENGTQKVVSPLFQEIANKKVGCDGKTFSKFHDLLSGIFTQGESSAPRKCYLEGRISLISGDSQQKSRRLLVALYLLFILEKSLRAPPEGPQRFSRRLWILWTSCAAVLGER